MLTDATKSTTDRLREQHQRVKAMFNQVIDAQRYERDEFNCVRATRAVQRPARR